MPFSYPVDNIGVQGLRMGTVTMLVLSLHACVALSIGFDIPILRPIACFLYITFVPGFVILRFFSTDKRDVEITILLSIGLSVAILMFFGLVINGLYPLLGIPHPLSVVPLIITLLAFTLILFLIGYRKRYSTQWTDKALVRSLANDQILRKIAISSAILAPIPILAVSGALYLKSDFLMIMTLGIMAVYAAVFFRSKLIPSELYFLAIFIVSISLLLSTSLVSKHVMGWDIAAEYYTFKETLISGSWKAPGFMVSYSFVDILNSVLSTTILPTIYSSVLNLEGETTYKVVYPILFSFVPLLMYATFKSQTSKPVAFLSSLFFVSSSTVFYGLEPISLVRQMIGGMFLLLSIFSLVNSEMSVKSRRLLFVVFSSALVVSHYSLAFIFVFYAVSVFILSTIRRKKGILNISLVLILIVVTLGWYIYVSSPPFEKLTEVFRNMVDQFANDILAPQARFDPGIASLSPTVQTGPVGLVHKALVYVTNFFIALGVIVALIKPRKFSLNSEFRLLVILSGGLLFLCIAVPNLAPTLDFTRFYQITILVLALSFGLGGMFFIQVVERISKPLLAKRVTGGDLDLRIMALILVAFLAFQVGFVNRLSGGFPYSYSLDLDRKKTSDDLDVVVTLYRIYTTEQEVAGAKWISEYMNRTMTVYGDSKPHNRILPLYASFTFDQVNDLYRKMSFLHRSYIYLGYLNTQKEIVVPRVGDYYNISEIDLSETDTTYSNAHSEILYSP